MRYKTIPGIAHISASSMDELENRVRFIADAINKEANDGWEFVGMYPVSGTIDHKLSSNLTQRLLGGGYADGDYKVNVLVFKKD